MSLQGRLDAALAPEATALERDALVYAISRPLTPEASPREHADFLVSVLADEQLRAMTGSGGRTVKSAAIRALLALGYPYALEIPPEAIELPVRFRFLKDRLRLGKTLIAGNAVVPAVVATLMILAEGTPGDWPLIPISVLALWTITLVPLFLVLKGRKRKSWVLKLLGSAGLVLSGLAVGSISLEMFFQVLGRGYRDWYTLTSVAFYGGGLLFSAAQLVGTYLLHSPEREK